MGLALVATGLLFGVVLPVRSGMLYTETALLWLVAMAGFFAVAAMLGARRSLTSSAARLGLFAAAAVVIVHNQIEMTFFQPESMGLMWLLVGAAAAGAVRPPQDTPSTGRRKGVGIAAGGALALILVAGMSLYVSGVIRHERAMEEAAAALRRGDVPLAVNRLATAEHASGWDTTALRWRVRLHAVEPMGPLVQAQRQAEARQRVDDALAWIDTTSATHGTPPTVARLRAQLLDRWAQLNGDRPGDVQAAREAYAELKPRSPFNVQDAWTRAELARRAGGWARRRSHLRRGFGFARAGLPRSGGSVDGRAASDRPGLCGLSRGAITGGRGIQAGGTVRVGTVGTPVCWVICSARRWASSASPAGTKHAAPETGDMCGQPHGCSQVFQKRAEPRFHGDGRVFEVVEQRGIGGAGALG